MGGLDDLLPDDADKSGRSSSRQTSTSSEPEYVKEFHSNKGTKKFTEDRWEEIKEQIRNKMEYSVGEVESLPADKRYEVLHEAALASDESLGVGELEHGTDVTCAICDVDCSYSYIELEGEAFCVNHPVIQVAKELDIGLKGTVNE